MKSNTTLRLILIATVIIILSGSIAYAGTTYTAVVSGNWSNTATWNGTAPAFNTTTEDIIIPSGITVTLDQDLTVNGYKSIIAVAGTLSIPSGFNLSVTNGTLSGAGTITGGNMILGVNPVMSFTGIVAVDSILIKKNIEWQFAGDLTVNKAITLIDASSLSIVSGGSFTIGKDANFIMSGGQLLNNGGSLNLSAPYDILYNDSVNTSLEATGAGVRDVTVNVNWHSRVVLNSDMTIHGTLTLLDGIFLIGNKTTLTIEGDVSSTGTGSILSDQFENIIINTNSDISGVIRLNGMVNNLTIAVGAGNHVSLVDTFGVAGLLTLTSGTVNFLAHTNFTMSGDVDASGTGLIHADSTTDIRFGGKKSMTGALYFETGGNVIHNLNVFLDPNTGGTAKTGSNLTVTGTLGLNFGKLDIGSSTLSVPVGGLIKGHADSSSYVIVGQGGYLSLPVNTGQSSPVVFPIGTSGTFLPATAMVSGSSSSGMVRINVTPHIHEHLTKGTLVSASQPVVDATWDVKSDIGSNLNINIGLKWCSSSEINGFNRTQAYVSRYYGITWMKGSYSIASLDANNMFTLTANNLTSLSPMAVFDYNTSGVENQDAFANTSGSIECYPNPANELINISLPAAFSGQSFADLLDVNGRIVGSYKLDKNLISIATSQLSAGCYFIRISNDKGSEVKKFVKM